MINPHWTSGRPFGRSAEAAVGVEFATGVVGGLVVDRVRMYAEHLVGAEFARPGLDVDAVVDLVWVLNAPRSIRSTCGTPS